MPPMTNEPAVPPMPRSPEIGLRRPHSTVERLSSHERGRYRRPALGTSAAGPRVRVTFRRTDACGDRDGMTDAKSEEWSRWMREAIGGDEAAYRSFLYSVTPHLRTIARNRCRNWGLPASDAEDIVQDVLVTVHLKRSTWDPTRPIGPWLAAIVRNRAVDLQRRRGGRRNDVPIDDVIETLGTERDDGTDDLADAERLVDRLKDPARDIVRSISLGGAGVKDVAARLQMTEGAVRVALHRALKTLGALYRSENR
jgi:RNA polymerase sigma-70 factor (ECF subfamily)